MAQPAAASLVVAAPNATFHGTVDRLVWHKSTTADPAHRWMRAPIHELFVVPRTKRRSADAPA